MAGYAKVAELMNKHVELATFHRFGFLNCLNLLYLQAELVDLEERLRKSMNADLECATRLEHLSQEESRPASSTIGNETGPHVDRIDSGFELGDLSGPLPEGSESFIAVSSEHGSETISTRNDRVNSSRDWSLFAKMDRSRTWTIMLETRKTLNEYNKTLLELNTLNSVPSPTALDLKFLRVWFKNPQLGNFPLIGDDSDLWENTAREDLVALKAREGSDPITAFS